MYTICVLVASVLVLAYSPVRGTAEVMSHVTAHFGKSLEECRKESGLAKEVMEEFQHFWHEDFEVVHRELGCAIICMSNKLSLMHDDARVHHVNMADYVKSFSNGEILSDRMVQMIYNCEKKFVDVEDECTRVVKTAACFKEDCRQQGLAPEVATIEAALEQCYKIEAALEQC